MTDKIIAAIIAGGVSLIGACISYFYNRRKLKSEHDALLKGLKSKYSEKIHELRLELYGEAFDITDKINQRSAPDFINSHDELIDISNEISNWKRGKVSLVISGEVISIYHEFYDTLRKNPAGENYSEEQAKKIWNLRTRFRSTLRKDLWNWVDNGMIYEDV